MKGMRNMAKTINMSKIKACVRPQQVQKLVSAEVMEPCPKTGLDTSSYSTPRPVTIRVCTRKDMERTCPPKLCDCPQEIDGAAPKSRIMRWVSFILKGAIASGLVYWTTAEGVWGDSNQTEDLYYRIIATIAPTLPDLSDMENLPHIENMKHSASELYNHGVVKVISIIAAVPLSIQEKINDLIFPCPIEKDDQIEENKNGKK